MLQVKAVGFKKAYIDILRTLALYTKTHSSESRGQERTKQITKNKTFDELLCLLHEQTFS